MARVTVEDCVEKVTNRFELVMVASQRSREISSGAEPRLDRDRDKNPVVALREIAEEKVSPEELYNGLVQSLQRHVEVDEPEEDGFDAMASNPEFSGIGDRDTPDADDSSDADDKGAEAPEAAFSDDADETFSADAAGDSYFESSEDSSDDDGDLQPAATADHPPVTYEDAEEDDTKG